MSDKSKVWVRLRTFSKTHIHTHTHISLNIIHIFLSTYFLLILSNCHIDLMIFGGNWLINLP